MPKIFPWFWKVKAKFFPFVFWSAVSGTIQWILFLWLFTWNVCFSIDYLFIILYILIQTMFAHIISRSSIPNMLSQGGHHGGAVDLWSSHLLRLRFPFNSLAAFARIPCRFHLRGCRRVVFSAARHPFTLLSSSRIAHSYLRASFWTRSVCPFHSFYFLSNFMKFTCLI